MSEEVRKEMDLNPDCIVDKSSDEYKVFEFIYGRTGMQCGKYASPDTFYCYKYNRNQIVELLCDIKDRAILDLIKKELLNEMSDIFTGMLDIEVLDDLLKFSRQTENEISTNFFEELRKTIK